MQALPSPIGEGALRASGVLSAASPHQLAAGETKAQRGEARGSWDINTAIWPVGVSCRRQSTWVLDPVLRTPSW